MRLKLTIAALTLLLLLCGAAFALVEIKQTALADLPPLHSGDVIFRTGLSAQSRAVMIASRSLYSHMGVIDVAADGSVFVIEAAGPVRRTKLSQWIQGGVGGWVTVRRFRTLPKDSPDKIVAAARALEGRPYDPLFLFNSKGVYCSELVYLAYQSAGISVGQVQHLGDLHMDNIFVQNLIKSRWKTHPACKGVSSYESCYPKILSQPLITPASIASDPNFVTVFDDYP